MELQNIIKSIGELNYDWYLEKRKFFELEPQFEKDYNQVFVNWGYRDDDDFDEKTGKTHYFKSLIDAENTRPIDFIEYCWNSEFENGLWANNEIYYDDGPCFKHDLPKDVKPILEDVKTYFITRLKGVNETNIKALEVIDVMNQIKVAFQTTKNSTIDYISLKESLYEKIKLKIWNEYGNVIQVYQKFSKSLNEKEKNPNIEEQIHSDLTTDKISTPIYKVLTKELCDEIVNLNILPLSLGYFFEKEKNCNLTPGQLLFNCLSPEPKKSSSAKFNVQSKIGTLYNFIIVLNRYINFVYKDVIYSNCFKHKGVDLKQRNFETHKSKNKKKNIQILQLESIFTN